MLFACRLRQALPYYAFHYAAATLMLMLPLSRAIFAAALRQLMLIARIFTSYAPAIRHVTMPLRYYHMIC